MMIFLFVGSVLKTRFHKHFSQRKTFVHEQSCHANDCHLIELSSKISAVSVISAGQL